MSSATQRRHIHFIGVGGIGMSGIAEIFLKRGETISGSDLNESELTHRLAGLGAKVFVGHRAENVIGANVVVISSAVKSSNPELVEAKRNGIPVLARAELLAELMRDKEAIAVAGTHGKTTTTSMLSVMLTEAGLDPTLVIGGQVDSLGGNARLGSGKLVIAEADESDGSFLKLPARFGVVTNIDNDHLDHYGSLTAIDEAFISFVSGLATDGLAAVCVEDPGVQRCLPRLKSAGRAILTYGFSASADLYATELRTAGMSQSFEICSRIGSTAAHQELGRVTLQIPGRHNVLNALAAIALGLRLEVPFSRLAAGLERFRGVKRRFEIRWQDPSGRRVIVDDYGHHPTEIAATLSAARSYWPGRIITVFQPHRYTRTQSCWEGFTSVFTGSDLVLLTEIYPAGEDPIPEITSEALTRSIASTGSLSRHTGDLQATARAVLEEFRDGDLLICLGAGSITRLPESLIPQLSSESA